MVNVDKKSLFISLYDIPNDCMIKKLIMSKGKLIKMCLAEIVRSLFADSEVIDSSIILRFYHIMAPFGYSFTLLRVVGKYETLTIPCNLRL